MKKVLQRELYIVKYGQEPAFRIKKWLLTLAAVFGIYMWAGWNGVLWFIKIALILGLCIHFFFRYKTNGWTKPWWVMKKIVKTPFD